MAARSDTDALVNEIVDKLLHKLNTTILNRPGYNCTGSKFTCGEYTCTANKHSCKDVYECTIKFIEPASVI